MGGGVGGGGGRGHYFDRCISQSFAVGGGKLACASNRPGTHESLISVVGHRSHAHRPCPVLMRMTGQVDLSDRKTRHHNILRIPIVRVTQILLVRFNTPSSFYAIFDKLHKLS